MESAKRTNQLRIALIGFGEAARAIVDSLSSQGGLSFAAYDILQESANDRRAIDAAAGSRGVRLASSHVAAASGADWVISAVTAASSLEAARATLGGLRAGQVFVDINSVSPGRKRDTAALVTGAGALYLDMAVMAPIHPAGHRTPVLVAGVVPPDVLGTLKRLDFRFDQVGESPGEATAIKMVRSLFVKGMEAVTTQTLLAARAAGCSDRVIASIIKSYPGLGWPQFADYQLERVATHGVRRAAEMRESAAFLDDLGVGGDLARAIAAVQDSVGQLQLDSLEKAPDAILDAISSRLGLAR